jgi:D-xylose transport system permease protein
MPRPEAKRVSNEGLSALPGPTEPSTAVLAGSPSRRFDTSQLRAFALVGILVAVAIVFQILTNGLFLSPRNLTNLSLQVSTTAILCAGIVMVMVPGHIDLSLGASIIMCAVVASLSIIHFDAPVPVGLLIGLLTGLLLGVWHGFWVAFMGVPAFVVTLASFIGLRGIEIVITQGKSLSPGQDITAMSHYYLPQVVSTAMLAALWVGFLILRLRSRNARSAAGIDVRMGTFVVIPVAILGVLCLAATYVSISYQGVPLPVAVMATVVVAATFILGNTRFGRQLYALGGNREASRLAGIDIRKSTFGVFMIMGLLYGVAGMVHIARIGAAEPAGAQGQELLVIAAAVIGGTSLAGGRGTVIGAVLGAILMESLNNGMSLMNFPASYQLVTLGGVLLLAVYIDVYTRRVRT